MAQAGGEWGGPGGPRRFRRVTTVLAVVVALAAALAAAPPAAARSGVAPPGRPGPDRGPVGGGTTPGTDPGGATGGTGEEANGETGGEPVGGTDGVGDPADGPSVVVEPFTGPAGAPRVAVIGDSVTWLSYTSLYWLLGAERRVSVDGRPGYTLAGQLPTAEAYAAVGPPEVVVVNLGTNDATANTAPAAAEAALGALVARFPEARCVVLTTVNANTLDPARNWWANSFNFWVLWALAQRDHRVRLADWNSAVAGYYRAGQPYGPLTTDLIHPLGYGQLGLASITEQAIDTCPTP